jgi:hypothetical protein
VAVSIVDPPMEYPFQEQEPEELFDELMPKPWSEWATGSEQFDREIYTAMDLIVRHVRDCVCMRAGYSYISKVIVNGLVIWLEAAERYGQAEPTIERVRLFHSTLWDTVLQVTGWRKEAQSSGRAWEVHCARAQKQMAQKLSLAEKLVDGIERRDEERAQSLEERVKAKTKELWG